MFRPNIQSVVFSTVFLIPAFLLAQPPGRGRPTGGMQAAPPMEMILQIFQQADANRDGSVTKAEFAATMQNQARGARNGGGTRNANARGQQRGPGGPPPHEAGEGEHPRGNNGPPPTPGQVIPEQMIASLNLNKKQTRQLTALQSDVNKRLAAILTDEQKGQLQSGPPPHGPPNGEGDQRKPTVSRLDRPAFEE